MLAYSRTHYHDQEMEVKEERRRRMMMMMMKMMMMIINCDQT